MMKDHILKTLTEFGLTEKEARIYLAMLDLDGATVFQISRSSGVNRSSAYVILDSLKKRGLAGVSDERSIRKYVAASPDALAHAAHLDAEKRNLISKSVEKIIPELKARYKGTKRRPTIRMFDGPLGIREIFEDLFKIKADPLLRTYADASKMAKYLPGFDEFNQKRVKNKINMHAINPASPEVINFIFEKKNLPPKGDELYLIPKDKFNFPVHVGIYGDRVAFISMTGEFGIIIESAEVAASMKNSFDLSWEEARKLNLMIRKQLFKKA